MNNLRCFEQVPMIKKVTEDLYLLSLPYAFGMEQVNSFLFRGKKGFTVIDTGSYSQEGIDIWENLMASGISVEKVVLTHFHIDHLGLARWFQEKHQVPVFISNLGYIEMKRRQNKDHANFVINLFKQHCSEDFSEVKLEDLSSFYNFKPDGIFENGEQIMIGNEMYEALWTPGHSSDHFCFYNHKQKTMIVGDHVLEKVSPVILIESQNDVNPLKDYFNSLEKMKGYVIKLALPGHGNLMGSLDNRIEEIRSGHIHRMKQILESIKSEEKTAWQVCQDSYSKGVKLQSFAPLMATITRCMYLESVGKVKSKLIDETVFYRSVE